MEEKKKRITRCRYSLPHCVGGSIEYHCVADGWEDDKVRVCTEEECEQCIRFNSRYIEYPIFVNKIENRPIKAHSMDIASVPWSLYGLAARSMEIRLILEYIWGNFRSRF